MPLTQTDQNLAIAALKRAQEPLMHYDSEIYNCIENELDSQRTSLKLIASENYCSAEVQLAMANCLTDKYAEGYAGRRFYAGCEQIDQIESIAQKRAMELFEAEYAFVQPHCGADANLLAFHAVLSEKIQKPFLEARNVQSPMALSHEDYAHLRNKLNKQTLLGMSLDAGGHLTHGYRMNLSARIFDVHNYGVNPQTYLIDYNEIEEKAKKHRPLILLAGYSAYSRLIDFRIMRQIADQVGAVLMGDIAHFAGLVAGKQITGNYNPIPYCDIATSTTHKTLRGPRGGLVLCKQWLQEQVQKACPVTMGGPLPHVMAAKAIAFKEALCPDFKLYAKSVIDNAKTLATSLQEEGIEILTGGTDNHLLLINLKNMPITGMQAESALRSIRITTNRNAIANDPKGPWKTSGLRIGTPALTTRGMGAEEMKVIAKIIAKTLKNLKPHDDGKSWELVPSLSQKLQEEVQALCSPFPLYPGL